VADEASDPSSLLNFYRRMLQVRRSTPALVAGDYRALDPRSESYFAFLRHDATTGQTCLVALNFSSEEQTVAFDRSEMSGKQTRLLFSSHARQEQPLSLGRLALAPFEVFIAELT
jgi:glycosidase